MSWTVILPGQPPSGNHAYKIGRGYRRGGIAYPRMVKTPEAEAYQHGVALLVRTARPSDWRAGGQVRITYRMFLERKADADNILKVLNDALMGALGIDDDAILPCVTQKEVVGKRAARIEIEVE